MLGSHQAKSQYTGGSNDGYSSGTTCSSTLDGTTTALTISAISGSSVFCNNSAETYSVSVTAGAADYFLWTGPTGASVASQQVEGYASLLFGTTSGNVTVVAGNSCGTDTEVLAVSNSACTYYEGGSDDGVSCEASCSSTLNGVATGLTISPISGSAIFCDNSSETYFTTVTSGAAHYFLWTLPTGATVSSQQIDGYANVLFGTTSGNVTVEVGNSCAIVTETLAVSNSTCTYFNGGTDDGTSCEASCASTLDGVATGLTIAAIAGSSVFCNNSSETYSTSVTTGVADYFLWTGPTGTTVASQQIEGYASLLFGTTSGNVTVEVGNSCASVTETLAVSNLACTYYNGDADEGFSCEASCATTLAGVATGLSISAISGSSVFCDNSSETYFTTVTTGVADYFLWTLPTGASVSSQQVPGYANILFGTTSGNITVEAGNSCASVTETIPVSNLACDYYEGGTDEGFSCEASCATTLAGVATGLSISAISGSSVFCNNSTETYFTTVTTGVADYFLWTGPAGASVASQQIEGYASILFGTTSGNITVEAGNACASVTETIPVTNLACTYYFGGDDEGFSCESACATTLDGTSSGLTISAISGPLTFCNNSTETYFTTVTTGAADYFLWTGPAGSSVVSQQISGYVNFLFGTTSGNITVEAGNSCGTDTETLAVTNTACTFFQGGNNDGFALATSATSIPLPIQLVEFDAVPNGEKVDLLWTTITEINNETFVIEKSLDTKVFEKVTSLPGAGTDYGVNNYYSFDPSPYEGLSYYRLKQVDYNGDSTYSDIKPVYFEPDNSDYSIFPNPTKGNNIRIFLPEVSKKEESFYVTILNAQGLLVKKIDLGPCFPNCAIEQLNLPPGLYTIQLEGERWRGNWSTKKLVVN